MKVRIAQAPLEASQGTALSLARRLMREKNWRATQLATALDKPPHVVRRCLRGERQFDIEDVVGIARLGGFSLDSAFDLPRSEPEAAAQSTEDLRELIQHELSCGMHRIIEGMGHALLQFARHPQPAGSHSAAALADSRERLEAQARLSLQSILAAEERAAAAPPTRRRSARQRGA